MISYNNGLKIRILSTEFAPTMNERSSEAEKEAIITPSSLSPGGSLWQSCVDQLAQELPEQQFNTWIKPLSAIVQDDLSRVTLLIANRFKLDWIRAQYSARISSMLERIYGQPVYLELVLDPKNHLPGRCQPPKCWITSPSTSQQSSVKSEHLVAQRID